MTAHPPNRRPGRLPGQGLSLDRTRPVAFRFDGRQFMGFHGDTLASALLASGVRLMGRSFKYHRPRGPLTAGPEEPNALVEVLEPGGQQTPNVRATQAEIFNGMVAQSQNRWPSLDRDLMAVNDLLHPFLGAGFYYKTFMWPAKWWESLYEPAIRRAAGLGRLSGRHDTAPYEKAHAFCDLLVIGSGPAGLIAALVAGRAGARVILAEQDAAFGGQLLVGAPVLDDRPGPDWAAGVLAELAALPNVRLMARTTVTGAYDDGHFGALERVALHLADPGQAPRECFWRIRATRAILATGALERPIAHPDNDRPGVMLTSAIQAYAARWGVDPGATVIFGTHDGALQMARDLTARGVQIAAYVDPRPGLSVLEEFPVYPGAQVVGTRGRLGLHEVAVRHAGGISRIAADTLGLSGGWNPTLHLTCHLNGRPVWDAGLAAFVPRPGAVPGLTAVGAAAGVMSTHGALASGLDAARAALADLGRAAPDLALPRAEDAPYAPAPFWAVDAPGRAWLDFANDVTTKDVRQSAAEGFASVEHMKRYTTQGMAPDQGKSSNVAALAVLAEATGRSVQDTGTTTFRPPFAPVSIAAMGAGGRGTGFAPERRMTSDAATRALGAPMIEAGLWYRPSYFPQPGETGWRPACDREVAMVRGTVGVTDVSTLGKIDVQGPDAGAFLDFVYTNTMSSLKPGRIRYGLMLREDGFVMDDGTCARLSPDHFVITTTTAAAGAVMRHLDWVQQAFFPGAALRLVSVTETWAQFAVAGPRARDLLARITDADLTNAALPFMAVTPAQVCGVAGRVFRISFSGELGYEVAVPARYGAALFDRLLAEAAALGGGPYGIEALNVLRIEKGFITHAEIHGRTTAFDIGMQRMIATTKDCVGQAASRRPGLMDAGRAQLVGLVPLDPGAELSAGAHLYPPEAAAVPAAGQGYVTSVAPSVTLGHWIALAFLNGGRARLGEVVRLDDGLRGRRVDCRVVDPVFLDPDGGRMRG
jgi:heterotetrameric sarcosine oxidase alpha subunit